MVKNADAFFTKDEGRRMKDEKAETKIENRPSSLVLRTSCVEKNTF